MIGSAIERDDGRADDPSPGDARRAHRHPEPHAAARPSRAGARPGGARPDARRRAVHRPRPVQGRERHLRPRHRRRAADRRGRAADALRCGPATRSRASAATSSPSSPRRCRPARRRWRWPSGCCGRCRIRAARCPARASASPSARGGDSADGRDARRRHRPVPREGRGRGRVELFDNEMRARMLDRLQTEADLRGALERGRVRLHYQPIVALATGRVAGLEGLVRWEHPTRGADPAGRRSSRIAEETGAIIELGRFVIARACARRGALERAWPPDARRSR